MVQSIMGLMYLASFINKLKFQKMSGEISAVPGDTLEENTPHETRDEEHESRSEEHETRNEEHETKNEEPQQFCSSDTALEVGSILQ